MSFLDEMNRPALTVSPPGSPSVSPCLCGENCPFHERLIALEKRVATLEAVEFKRGQLRRTIRQVIEQYKGPFTARHIREIMHARHPGVLPVTDYFQVEQYLRRLEKAGELLERHPGRGPHPTVYERVKEGPIIVQKGGEQRNLHDKRESGFRAIVRAALDDLPEEFTILHLRAWLRKHRPNSADIPYGSMSSTLYKLQQTKELIVLRGGRKLGKGLKVFTRGTVRIAPTGDLKTEMETAWQQVRKIIDTTKPAGPDEDLDKNLDQMAAKWAKYRARHAK